MTVQRGQNKLLLFVDVSKIFPKELKNESGQKIAELDGLTLCCTPQLGQIEI